ncbi:MAG: hypothetical protein OXQ89_00225 [Rhodospirillaceae bacterium]|nr:hypothetical protein [Rhodospirillaceae bacterium]
MTRWSHSSPYQCEKAYAKYAHHSHYVDLHNRGAFDEYIERTDLRPRR